MVKITITILLFLVIINSFILAKTTQTGTEEIPGMILIKGGPIGDFYMGKYEVTNKEYRQFDSKHKSNWTNPDCPVESINWEDAVAYCKWLSKKTGKNYRLPSEAEWEYACRGGTTTKYYWGNTMDDSYCWYGNSDGKLHPVGKKKPNKFGLYDMAGNVWEWCSDWYDASHSTHVAKGGCYNSGYESCQSDYRGSLPDFHYGAPGFRLVRESYDYSKSDHWLSLPASPGKEVDVFYVYPTAWQKVDPNEPNICKIDNPSMLKGSKEAFLLQATAFETVGNIYAPYYRQADAGYTLTLPSLEEQDEFTGGIPKSDVFAAFDY